MQIKSLFADRDGTLIEKRGYPKELPGIIKNIRERGISFSIASGAGLEPLVRLHKELIGPDSAREEECIIHESSLLYMLKTGREYETKGLSADELDEINKYLSSLDEEFFGGLVKHQGKTMIYWVTKEFEGSGVTNKSNLSAGFEQIKPRVEQQFECAQVLMTADGIDIQGKHTSKASPIETYSHIMGIPIEQIAAIGDSANDMAMLRLVGEMGGCVAYVGECTDYRKEIAKYRNAIIPERNGPEGTIQVLREVLQQIYAAKKG